MWREQSIGRVGYIRLFLLELRSSLLRLLIEKIYLRLTEFSKSSG